MSGSGDEGKNSGGSTAPAPSTLGTSLVGSFLGALGGLALIATTVYGVRRYSAANKVDPDGVVVKPWDGGAPSGSPGSTLPRAGQTSRFSTGILPTRRPSTGSENASRIESRYSAFFVNNPMYTVSSPIVKRFSMLRNSYNGSVESSRQPVPLNV